MNYRESVLNIGYKLKITDWKILYAYYTYRKPQTISPPPRPTTCTNAHLIPNISPPPRI
jgi:hypothetical protein